ELSARSSVVQMSTDPGPLFSTPLPRGERGREEGEELGLARELCEYGQRLSGAFRNPGEPPFEDTYKDYGVYLAALAGEGTEEAVAHFRAKAEANPVEEAGTGPAEVLVQLLQRLDRPAEALAAARRHLAAADGRLGYLADLCQRAGDFGTLAEVAREQGNAVQFVAGLLASRPA